MKLKITLSLPNKKLATHHLQTHNNYKNEQQRYLQKTPCSPSTS